MGWILKLVPKETLARIIYSAALNSKAGKKFQTYIPLAATLAYALVIALKATGAAGADSALDLLHSLGIQPGVSEAEIVVAVGGFAGLVNKISRLAIAAQGVVVPPTSAPILRTEEQFDSFNKLYNKLRTEGVGFTEARELALKSLSAASAPLPTVEVKAKKKAAKGEQAAAIEAPADEPKKDA